MATPAQELVSFFAFEYRKKLDVPYIPVWGRDVKIINDILQYIDIGTLKDIIALYFRDEQAEYCIPYLKVKLNRLILEHKARLKGLKKLENPYAERFL